MLLGCHLVVFGAIGMSFAAIGMSFGGIGCQTNEPALFTACDGVWRGAKGEHMVIDSVLWPQKVA